MHVYTVKFTERTWDGKTQKATLKTKKFRDSPIQVNLVIWTGLVRAAAVEVDSSVGEPYDAMAVKKHFTKRRRESGGVKSTIVDFVNFAIQADPLLKGCPEVREFEFDRLVFVRRRWATPSEILRYLCLCRAEFEGVGLPVGMTVAEIRRRIAVSHGLQAPDWSGFWRNVIPQVQQNGRQNLITWRVGKRSKPGT